MYHSTPHFLSYVDVHLAFSPFSRKTYTDPGDGGKTNSNGEGEGGRQFNVWRNVARLFARTEFVMMLDVDFAVCTDWRAAVRSALQGAEADHMLSNGIARRSDHASASTPEMTHAQIATMLREGSAALVIPVFEYATQEDGEDQNTFPQNKQASNSSALGPSTSDPHFRTYFALSAPSLP